MPKINLRPFSGDPINFQPFFDSFKSAIDDNKKLSNIDKMNYLRSLLNGAAAAAIQGLPLTSENYEEAKTILNKRYGNKQTIINAHMEGLIKIPGVTPYDGLKQLRQFFDHIENHIHSLQSLGIESEPYRKLLIPLIMEKLLGEHRLIISRKIEQDVWDLDTLLKALNVELEARGRCVLVGMQNYSEQGQANKSFGQFFRGSKPKHSPSTAAALVTQMRNMNCTYCRQVHSSVNCKIVSDIRARKNLLRQQGRCFICLRCNHLANNCTSTSQCLNCPKRHHVSICEAYLSQGTVGAGNTVQSNSYVLAPEASSFKPQAKNETSTDSCQAQVTPVVTAFVDSSTSVLLRTAMVSVFPVDNSEKAINVRLFFGSGSQRSYISDRLRNRLRLPTLKTEKLLIKTFGDDREQLRECDTVRFAAKGLNDNLMLYINAHTVPLICSPIQNQAIQFAVESYDHLSHIELADSMKFSQNLEMDVDLLIWSDFDWNFLTGEIRRGGGGGGEVGHVAMKTKVGWVLSGTVCQASTSQAASTNLVTSHVMHLETSSLDCSSSKLKDPLVQQLQRFWEIESIGVSLDEGSVHDKFLDAIKQRDGRYEVCLPWWEQHPLLHDNFDLAMSRLRLCFQTFESSPSYLLNMIR